MNCISGLVTQIYPWLGPAQHAPHCTHSKYRPATYQGVVFFVGTIITISRQHLCPAFGGLVRQRGGLRRIWPNNPPELFLLAPSPGTPNLVAHHNQ